MLKAVYATAPKIPKITTPLRSVFDLGFDGSTDAGNVDVGPGGGFEPIRRLSNRKHTSEFARYANFWLASRCLYRGIVDKSLRVWRLRGEEDT